MPADVDVRLAGPSDAGFLVTENAPLTVDVVNRKIANEEILVAVHQDRLVGFVRIGLLWSRFPFIELIVVPDPAMRGKGVGTALLRTLEDRYNGVTDYIYSSCVSSEEEPQAWHRSRGFEDCGYLAHLNEGNEGEIFFRKALGRSGR